jgi:hypothetical protein
MGRMMQSPRIVLAVALVLASCHADVTVGANDGNDTTSVAITLPAGYGDSGKMTTDFAIRTFPIIPLRSSPQAELVGPAGPIDSPFDLTWHGGQVVAARPYAYSRDVYINCGTGSANWASCWGTSGLWPRIVLEDLPYTDYLGIADQYIGPNFFFVSEVPVTTSQIPVPPGFTNPTLFLNDIKGIVMVASAAITNASGYANMFHVFLPKDTDVCGITSGNVVSDTACYSPDHASTYRFCAFHSSFNDAQGRHFLYSVEPYQYVSGCALTGQRVIDATASTLAHEFFETITDPDPGSGWFNNLTGLEVGDMCQAFSDNVVLRLHNYVIQKMYSNEAHGCTDGS